MEDLFKKVRTFIRRNPDASIQQVAEECEVEVRQIRQWIREERLSFSKDSDIGIDCERCGKSIKTGRLCEECKREQVDELKSINEPHHGKVVEEEPRERPKTQMRFLNRENREGRR